MHRFMALACLSSDTLRRKPGEQIRIVNLSRAGREGATRACSLVAQQDKTRRTAHGAVHKPRRMPCPALRMHGRNG